MIDDFFGLGVLEGKGAHEAFLAAAGLLGLEQLAHFAQIDHRVHHLEAIGRPQRRDLGVGAEHRLDLLDRGLGDQPIEREGNLDELVRQSAFQLLGVNARHQARIELLDVDDRQHLAVLEQREAASQQVRVD